MKTCLKNHILLLALFSLTVFSGLTGCSKEEDDKFTPTLPPITQTGENTFGCYVDGRILIPRDGTGTFNSPDRGMRFVNGPGYYEIRVHDFASEKTSRITLHIIGLDSIGVGEYIVNESNCMEGLQSLITNNIHCRVYDYDENIYKIYCSVENSGVINITHFDDELISGTFSCTAVNRDNPNEFIEITEGRFDIDRNTINNTKFP